MVKSKRKKKVNKVRRKKVAVKKATVKKAKIRTKTVSKKRRKSVRRNRVKKSKSLFFNLRKLTLKTSAFLILICLNWTGLSAIITTVAYLNDTESSIDNNFTAGTLDFILTSPSGFNPSAMEIGESATRTISFVNSGNDPKYKVSAVSFTGLLCSYLDLTAYVDATGTIYSGDLMNFVDFGPQDFSNPDDWVFRLTLPTGTPEDLVGENCQFDFAFFGSQIRNNLLFGQGFNDTEEIDNNVAAKVCYDAETRSKGYWKNHDAVYKPYLPQYLGCNSTSSECVSGYEEVKTKAKVTQILETDYELSMRNKLRGQLLAMKFNIAHFKIGEYVPGTSTENLNQIVADADALLKQTPAPSDGTLEIMMEFLDDLNQDSQFRACSTSVVKVIIPNGGEVWWVGRYYDLTWSTKNLICSDVSLVSIWYSADSGVTWGNIATTTENDGVYNWRIPLYLENGGYYVPSSRARIKVVTRCSETFLTNGWDMSDEDFCPPIDYELLLPEEIEALKAMGLYEEPSEPGLSEEPIESTSTETEELTPDSPTTTEEIHGVSIVLPDPTEIPVEILEEILPNEENSVSSDPLIEETTIDETTNVVPEESAPEEIPVETIPAETPAPEETLTQDTPVTEAEPIIVPDSGSPQSGDGGDGGDGGETGGSGEASAPAVEASAPSVDAGATE